MHKVQYFMIVACIAIITFIGASYIAYCRVCAQAQAPACCADLHNMAPELLKQYIQINTAQPHPQYGAAIAFLKKLADQDGFLSHQIVLPSGLPIFIIEYPGTDASLPALALNHHMDVVAADGACWDHGPFQGVIAHDTVYGRGTQDMKGIGICHYLALRELKHSQCRLKRTVYLIAVPDEEVGGFKGAGQLVHTKEFQQLNIGYVLDEGLPSGQNDILYIKTTERKPLQVRFELQGAAAHGSKLECMNVVHTMIDFLAQLSKLQHEQQKKIQDIKDLGQLLSINITSIHAGVCPDKDKPAAGVNMVPGYVTATADIRVPVCMKLAQAKALLAEFMTEFPAIKHQVVAQVDDYQSPVVAGSEFYKTIERTIAKHGLKAKELHFQATSDLRYYLPRITAGYGLTPFTVKENLHGVNESVPISDLLRGIGIFKDIILNFCS